MANEKGQVPNGYFWGDRGRDGQQTGKRSPEQGRFAPKETFFCLRIQLALFRGKVPMTSWWALCEGLRSPEQTIGRSCLEMGAGYTTIQFNVFYTYISFCLFSDFRDIFYMPFSVISFEDIADVFFGWCGANIYTLSPHPQFPFSPLRLPMVNSSLQIWSRKFQK